MPSHTVFTFEHVLHALDVMHTTANEEERRQAEKYLEEFEETNSAWEICHLILDQGKDIRYRHFAARTYKSKVMSSFNNLAPDDKAKIRDIILHHISASNDKEDRAVMVALAVALVDLALQMPTWSDAANDVMTRFGDKPSFFPILLEVLTLFPEEMNNDKLHLSSSRRAFLKDELKRMGPKITSLLDNYASGPGRTDIESTGKIYDCLGSWCNIGALHFPDTVNIDLMKNLFMYLGDINTPLPIHDACTGCLTSALPDFVQESSAAKQKLVGLVDTILKFEDVYKLCVQKEDLDRCKNFTRIFVELAETMTEGESGAVDIFAFPRLLEVLLMCCDHPDYEVVEYVVDFWPSLCEVVSPQNSVAFETYTACFSRLIVALWKSCRYDPDGDWLMDGNDEFESYRRHAWDSVNEISQLLGYVPGWEALMHLLSANDSQWDAVESALFLMSALASRVPAEDDSLITPVVAALVNMTNTPKLCFQHTVCTLFGHLAHWFGRHPQYTDQVMTITANALAFRKLADPASWALQELSSYCRSHLTRYFHQLMELLLRLEGLGLREEEMESVSTATVNILNEMPAEVKLQSLRELCSLVRQPLEKIIIARRQKIDSSSMKTAPIIWLNHLGAIFKNLRVAQFDLERNPIAEMINELWPLLGEVAMAYVDSNDVMEKVVRCLRYMVRFLGKGYGAVLLPNFAKFTGLYASAHHSCILYLASILIDEFAELPDTHEGFASMLEGLCQPTFSVLNSDASVRQNPDIIEDFFRVCRRYAERAGNALVFHPRIDDILKCSLVCCLSTNHQANHAVYSFWNVFLQIGNLSPEICARISILVQSYAQELICKGIQSVFRDSHVYTVADVAQLLQDLYQYDPQATSLSVWLTKAIGSLPQPQQADSIAGRDANIRELQNIMLTNSSLDSKIAALSTFINLYR